MKHSNNTPNKLIHSKSPYLLQHAYNPVEWQSWSSEAWAEAKEKNKLVLVSIGYSACHWCHVMEHESFEDYQTAEMMNLALVNIKVDREERPDVDMVYMDACQLMTGRGGWPLNVICLPDGRPVYAGTYFPMAQWQQIVMELSTQFQSDPAKFEDYATKLFQDLQKLNAALPSKDLQFSRKNIYDFFELYAKDIDWQEGGLNRSPKFMLPNQYEYVLDYFLISEDTKAKEFLHLSLLKMFNGGIYDTLRGGFYRYSTDKKWFAPHFEKMLYDNAQLIALYARTYSWSNASVYKDVSLESIEFCMRELKSPNGAFYAALDADSEGIEGRFYVFTKTELLQVLSPEEFEFAEQLYGITENGNWEHGLNILHTQLAPLQMIEKLNLSSQQYLALLESMKQKLFHLQEKRERPGLDDKIILCWNGLMLKALAVSALHLQSNTLLAEAVALESALWNIFYQESTQTLKRIHAKGETYIDAFLEDYACFIEGQIQLYQSSGNEMYIERAKILTNKALELFYNKDTQQLYFAPNNGEQLIVNKSDNTDDVISSPNSLFAHCLMDLSLHTGNFEYAEIAKGLLSQNVSQLEKYPAWNTNWIRLYMENTLGQITVALSDHFSEGDIFKFKSGLPSWVHVGKINPKSDLSWLQHTESPEPAIYVCAGNQCFEAVQTLEQAFEIIDEVVSMG